MRCGHRQTVLGAFGRGGRSPHRASTQAVGLSDGDALVIHDDSPEQWCPGDPVAVLVHGLGGDHRSGYMVRIAAKLNRRGVRVIRVDQRGCGASQALSRKAFHAGRTSDIADVLDWVTETCPRAPLALVGFSLGGNAALKLMGETDHSRTWNLRSVIAVAPPIDLAYCSQNLCKPERRFYDRRFVRKLCRQLHWRCRWVAGVEEPPPGFRPRSVFEFDDQYTAVVSGFRGAQDYYVRSSAAPLLKSIGIETKILVSKDDPVVPSEIFDELQDCDHLQIVKTRYGGHMGYLGVKGIDPDRRWMDWRIVNWVTSMPSG